MSDAGSFSLSLSATQPLDTGGPAAPPVPATTEPHADHSAPTSVSDDAGVVGLGIPVYTLNVRAGGWSKAEIDALPIPEVASPSKWPTPAEVDE